MSYDVRCVANALIKMAYEDESREQMTNMKLQKLLYYEQAYHLARFGTPLFDDDIEAWQYGPVVPSVYDAFSASGRKPLEPDYDLGIEGMSDEEANVFFNVYDIFSQYSAYGLMGMTHNEEPWLNARRPLGRGNVIPKDVIMDYFVKRIKNAAQQKDC